MRNVYQIVTDRMLQLLEAGTVPWRRPWGGVGAEPRSAITRKPYRGCNVFMLSAASYDSPYWLTYRQAERFEGHVRKGEHGWPVVFWHVDEKPDPKTGENRTLFLLRYYTVFNVDQCEGLPAKLAERDQPLVLDFQPVEACERVLGNLPAGHAEIVTQGSQACYVPSLDQVRMPKRERFVSAEDYYSVLFHELTHSTGHKSRLNREGIESVAPFGSPTYSREELVAEMGAAFLCGHCGIDVPTLQDNQAAYLASWIRALRGDAKLIVTAAAQAQKAADWLLGPAVVEPSEAEPVAADCA